METAIGDKRRLAPPIRPPVAKQQVQQTGQQRAANDSPDNGEGLAVDVDDQERGQVKRLGDPQAEVGADEPNGDSGQAAAARVADQRLANGARDGGDDDQYDEAG